MYLYMYVILRGLYVIELQTFVYSYRKSFDFFLNPEQLLHSASSAFLSPLCFPQPISFLPILHLISLVLLVFQSCVSVVCSHSLSIVLFVVCSTCFVSPASLEWESYSLANTAHRHLSPPALLHITPPLESTHEWINDWMCAAVTI